jgi:hypothetical protein
MRVVAASGAVTVGATVSSDRAKAWDRIPVDIRCADCDVLGKIEANGNNDGEIDWGLDKTGPGITGTVIDDRTFEFDVDGDGTEGATVEFTNYYEKSEGEKTGFDFVTDGLGLCEVEIKGGPYLNEYSLGTAVRGTELLAPDKSRGKRKGLSYVRFRYCDTVRACVLSSDVSFDPVTTIDPTSDEVRLALWWGPRHFSDQYLFENGTGPETGGRILGDRDGDSTDDVCFDFDLRDAVVNDPTRVNAPDKMKVSFLIRERGSDGSLFVSQTQDGIVVDSPTPT